MEQKEAEDLVNKLVNNLSKISLYFHILFLTANLSEKKLKNEEIEMSVWPVDVPKYLIDSLYVALGEKHMTTFMNQLVRRGILGYIEDTEKEYHSEIEDHYKYVCQLKEAVKNNPSIDIVDMVYKYTIENKIVDENTTKEEFIIQFDDLIKKMGI